MPNGQSPIYGERQSFNAMTGALRSKQHPKPLSTPALELEANRRCARRVIGSGMPRA
jgi:hypothetical protein